VAFQSQTTSAFAGAPATDQIATTSDEIKCCLMELLTIVSPLHGRYPGTGRCVTYSQWSMFRSIGLRDEAASV